MNSIKLFEEQKVRTAWDSDKEAWLVSVVDVIEILTGTDRARKYWSDLKSKLKNEGSELSEKIGQLKMQASDGKMRITDVATTEQLFRLIQSIPSPKAEPLKLWKVDSLLRLQILSLKHGVEKLLKNTKCLRV